MMIRLFCLILALGHLTHGSENASSSALAVVDPDPEAPTKIVIELNDEKQEAYIVSPGFPNRDYPPNSLIDYEITMILKDPLDQLSSRILLNFEMFAIQPSKRCHADALEIEDANGEQQT